jgi:hypothetical protein
MATPGDSWFPCVRTLAFLAFSKRVETLKDLLGTEYIAAMPARKSRAKPFPPVAEAAYGPYAAIM